MNEYCWVNRPVRVSEIRKHPSYEIVIKGLLRGKFDVELMKTVQKETDNKDEAEALYVIKKLKSISISISIKEEYSIKKRIDK